MKVPMIVIPPRYLLLFVYHNFNIIEELASLVSMHDRTTGADIFEKVDHCINNLGLVWVNLSC